jgi:hypothetical protein
MHDQDKPRASERFQQLCAAAHSRAGIVVQEIVAGFGERTIHAVGSRTRTWPGINAINPEPIACLEAEHEFERAAHASYLGYIWLARGAGRKWREIGEALYPYLEAVVAKESISEVAHDCRATPVPPGAPATMAAIRAVVADCDAQTDTPR